MRWVLLAMVTACGFAPVSAGGGGDGGNPGVDAVHFLDASQCGDGVRQADEECDDHNVAPGDGCDPTCKIEPAWTCPATGPCKHVTGLSFTPAEDLAVAGSSNGGGAFSHPCLTGSAVVGFDGDISDDMTDIGQMRSRCAKVTFDADGSLSWSIVAESPPEGDENNASLGAATCATNAIIVGFIANEDVYLSGLKLICLPVSFIHNTLSYGPTTTLPVFGPDRGAADLPATRCAAGEATDIFEGRSGATIDYFNLQCATLTAITQ